MSAIDERYLPRPLRGDTGGQVLFAVLAFTVVLVADARTSPCRRARRCICRRMR